MRRLAPFAVALLLLPPAAAAPLLAVPDHGDARLVLRLPWSTWVFVAHADADGAALRIASTGGAGARWAWPAREAPHPWHTGIVATTFWVGELFDATLADGSQVCSTYDAQWAYHWSGVDLGRVPADAAGCAGSILGGCDGVPGPAGRCETEPRTAENGFFPTRVAPKENPFYVDLPFDDVNDPVAFAMRCDVVPWADEPGYAGRCDDASFSYMKDRWVEIVGPNGATCYGQVEDAGPSHDDLYHDAAYVFGKDDARPAQRHFRNAGMDVSPALNGCLGFAELDGERDVVAWRFVDDADVPEGPWTRVVTKRQVS